MAPASPPPPSWGAGRLAPEAEARFEEGVAYCSRFFMGESEVQHALYKLTDIFEAEGTPYAIIGALALNEYGHRRATVDVDVVLREEDLQRFKEKHIGHGYAERVAGTGKLLDTELDVKVDVLRTGRFPGDGKPKPIAFPDGAASTPRSRRILNLVRSAKLTEDFADQLHPWVRGKFRELWTAAESEDPD